MMLKPEGRGARPKSNSSNSSKNGKNGSSSARSKKGHSKGTRGKGNSTSPVNPNLFSLIIDEGSKEIAHHGKSESNREISMENVAMQDTKKHYDKMSTNTFGHKMYENAAVIYAYFTGELTAASLPVFKDEYQKRRAYGIAFAAKRYEEVLKDVLLDSHFYSVYSKLEAQHHNNVMVMLMDYFDHSFRFSDSKRSVIKEDTEDPQELVREIQDAIVSHHVHICASFARCRIRDCALSLEDLLVDDSKETHRYAQHQPLYARVNTLKTTTDDVVKTFISEGFVLSEDTELLELTGKMFRRDPHFDDMLVFSNECKDDVYSHDTTLDLCLYPQDKSKYTVVEVMKSLLVEMAMQKDKAMTLMPGEMKSFLLKDGDDVLLTNPDSGSLSAHAASFISPERKLFICGCPRNSQKEIISRITASHIKNFELIEEQFVDISHNDDRLRKVRIILCNVSCSKSGVVNPVDFVLQEGNVAAKLLVGKVDVGKRKAIISDEYATLKHAVSFNQVQSILYFTLADNSAENEDLVMRVLKEYREDQVLIKNPFQLAPFLPDLVSSLRSHTQDAKGVMENLAIGGGEQYLKLRPSSRMNGCFVALLKRQFLESGPKEAVERGMKKGAKGRSNKKSVGMKYTKESPDKQEDVTENQLPGKAEVNPSEKRFQKFF